jgi:hypothetical protein
MDSGMLHEPSCNGLRLTGLKVVCIFIKKFKTIIHSPFQDNVVQHSFSQKFQFVDQAYGVGITPPLDLAMKPDIPLELQPQPYAAHNAGWEHLDAEFFSQFPAEFRWQLIQQKYLPLRILRNNP